MWKDIERKFSSLKNLKGKANYLRACIYFAIGLEKIPKVLSPGNKLSIDNINELTDDEEWPKMTIRF